MTPHQREQGLGTISRRAVLAGGGAAAVALFLPLGSAGASAPSVAVPLAPDLPRFLTTKELKTLRGLVDRFIPGPPEDPDPGAVAAGCAEAIDALLAAFTVNPPMIYAGAPFSDRAGSPVNHFAEFLPLDSYQERSWRVRIEGSQSRPEYEFNGAVQGYQEMYRAGLQALNTTSLGLPFADLPGPVRDVILRTTRDPAVQKLIDVAFPHTYQFMYGAPEYGGNRNLAGWKYTHFDGDVQPRGWTREQIEEPDTPENLPGLPAPLDLEAIVPLLPLSAGDALSTLVGTDSLTNLKTQIQGIVGSLDSLGIDRGAVDNAVAAVTDLLRQRRQGG